MNLDEQITQEIITSLEAKLTELVHSEPALNRTWLRTTEVADYLNLSVSQISALKAKGELNCSKLGRTNYYNKQEIDKILSTNQQ